MADYIDYPARLATHIIYMGILSMSNIRTNRKNHPARSPIPEFLQKNTNVIFSDWQMGDGIQAIHACETHGL